MGTRQVVNVYRKRRSEREYRFLFSEKAASGMAALATAVDMVMELRREFPDYDFIVVREASGQRPPAR